MRKQGGITMKYRITVNAILPIDMIVDVEPPPNPLADDYPQTLSIRLANAGWEKIVDVFDQSPLADLDVCEPYSVELTGHEVDES
jgi:hypothetical protein